MNIYKILFEHYSQKDSQAGIKCFLLAKDDEEVYRWLSSNPTIGEDWITTCYEGYEEEDEDFKRRIIDCKGQMFDEEYDLSGLYYGVTLHGWELLGNQYDYLDLTIISDLLYRAEGVK